MAAPVRANRIAFRRAVIVSVALHVALALVLIIVLQSRPDPRPMPPGIDTGFDVVVHAFNAGPLHEIVAAPPPEPISSTAVVKPPVSAPVEMGLTPRANIVPRTLPNEMLVVISHSVAARNVASASPSTAIPAIHGTLKPGQMIVYVLDSSGSMGEFGKLGLARSALLATLRGQLEDVRFQVIVYGSMAHTLGAVNTCVPATRANIDVAASVLAALEANGRSNHMEAVRLAAACRPDLILLLTDAEDLSYARFKPILAAAGKPITIRVAKVTASTVGPPQELR